MTVRELIRRLNNYNLDLQVTDQDAQVFGDDGTRFVVVERADEISYAKNAVYIHTWDNIDHEEYLKGEVDAFMMSWMGRRHRIKGHNRRTDRSWYLERNESS